MLFLLHNFLASESGQDESVIVVDRAAILSFIQYRAKRFDQQWAEAQLQAYDTHKLDALIDDYVTEEALYREASALNLDSNDYIIKRRLIQKMEFIARSSLSAPLIEDQALENYFAENRENYREPELVTFTHILFDGRKQGEPEAREKADQQLEMLVSQPAPFEQAGRYGDRFLYHLNYIERSREFVASHFGADFAAEVFAGDTRINQWWGPVRSEYGYHLILASRIQESRIPELEEVESVVRADLQRELDQEQLDEAIQLMIGRYAIERGDDLKAIGSGEGS